MPKLNLKPRSVGRQARLAVIAAAATGLFATSLVAARADTTDILLEQLKAKGILTKGEYHKLKARHEAEKATYRAGPPGGVVVKGPGVEYVTVCPKGICMRVGQVDVRLSGDLVFGGIEQFKAYGGPTPIGGLVGARNVASNAFAGGLLPSSISLSLATNQMGYDLGFTISAFTGGNNVNPGTVSNANSGGTPFALGTPGIDLRQVYGTVGNAGVGTFKIGRDLGLFGSDAILNDATLFGMGSPVTAATPSNTTLGRIGIGYVYADWLPGVVYTTPDFHGFTASIAAYTPLEATNGASPLALAPTQTFGSSSTPMVQGQIKWKGSLGGGGPAIVTKGEAPPSFGGINLTLSADAVWQGHRQDNASSFIVPQGTTANSWGVDGFGKADVAGFSFVAYGYYGKGLGTTGLFLNGFDAFGNPRTSYGGYGQASYTWDKLTVGGSWGVSGLNATAADFALGFGGVGGLVHYNESAIGFARYQLTSWMALQAEFVHTWSYANVGPSAQDDAIWLGTAWFF
jgi:hypothetical protein